MNSNPTTSKFANRNVLSLFQQHKASVSCQIAVIALGGALISAPAVADDPEKSAPVDYFEDLPVVLTASRMRQSAIEAPSAITVIDREMIVASGARQLVDVLRMVPGFYVGYVSGSFPVVAYHGLSDAYARRMQVLIDGVSIYSPLYGGIEWSEIPLALQDIERIEIVRGPNAVTFGANAFFAVINIITRDPAIELPFQADIVSGGSGTGDVVLRAAKHGEDLRFRFTAGQRNDHGFQQLPDSNRLNYFNLRASHRLSSVDELTLQARASHAHQLQGNYDVGIDDSNRERLRTVEQATLQLRWTHAPAADQEFWIQAYHHDRKARESVRFQFLSLVPYSINYDFDLKRDDIEFQHTLKFFSPLRMVWGGQWREDGAQAKSLLNSDAWKTNRLTRLFANLEYRPIDRLTLHGGTMFEHNSMNGSSLSPRLAATYQVTPGQVLRVGISKANRAPTLFENMANQSFDLTPAVLPLLPLISVHPGFHPAPLPVPYLASLPLLIQYQSSGNLEDEKIVSREIGYAIEVPEWRLGGDIRLFSDQISNLIVAGKTHQVSTVLQDPLNCAPPTLTKSCAMDLTNSPHPVHQRGIEISARWRPWSGAQIHVNSAGIHIDSIAADTLNTAPGHTRSLLFSQSLPYELAFSAAYYRIGSMKWQSSPKAISAYETLDLRLAKRIRWDNHHLELALVTRNAFGPYVSYPRPDRANNPAWPNNDQRTTYVQLSFAY